MIPYKKIDSMNHLKNISIENNIDPKKDKEFIPKFTVFTLGCKVNQYESDKIREGLCKKGFKEVSIKGKPLICIINTCTVTKEAARKSRQTIRRFKKISPHCKVYAIGCAAEIPEKAMKNIPKDVKLITNSQKEDLVKIICNDFKYCKEKETILLEGRTRANLKVQDGCNHFCTYCIIPYVRGRSRSREPEEVLKELLEMENQGYKEVVLTGIHLGDYGKKIKSSMKLPQLVSYLLKNSSIPRLRLSSLEPMDFSFDLLDIFTKNSRLCRHLHLPIQHASDNILKKMKRNYTLAQYDKILSKAYKTIPELAITTDIIVGFPGETNEDFDIMYEYIKKSPFFMLHVFPFSLHPGTAAFHLKDTVPAPIKKERVEKLITLGKQKTYKFLDNYINKSLNILVEHEYKDGMMVGHSDNYIEVAIPADKNLRGEILNINTIERVGELLYGKDPKPICFRR